MPEIDTSEYRSSHWKEPRGRGSWAFEFDGGEPEFCPFVDTYTKARAWAIKQAKERGVSRVVVCP